MESLWLAIAFVFGYGARRLGLPPLVGYLIAGFVLHALGARSGGLVDVRAQPAWQGRHSRLRAHP